MLKLKNITKIYPVANNNDVVALENISVNFRENEFVCVLGPSGCGKTTLLNIIGGLDRYTEGNLIINGISTKDYKDGDWDTYRNNSIGFVFQNYNLIPHQTVLENVELSLTLAGVSKKERIERAKKALEEVGLLNQIHKKPNQLSGGQMQRVAIARALVNNPTIVLADEPTGAVDSVMSIQIMELLKKIAETRLVVMVTHNSELSDKYATRIVKLLDGKIVDDTKPLEDIAEVKKEKPKKKSGMSWFTSLKLSLKNLFSKRGRTFMTSFAGSIGIIGIALVLSVANGFNLYIDSLQQNTLASYPLTVYSSILDRSSLMDNFGPSDDEGAYLPLDETGITASAMITYEDFASAQHENKFTQEYLDYINSKILNAVDEDGDPIELVTSIEYNYGIVENLFTSNNGTVRKLSIPTYSMEEMMVNMDMSKLMQYAESYSSTHSGVNWDKLLDNDEFMKNNYDVLAGAYPTEYNQLALILNSKNQIDKSVLLALGFSDEEISAGFDASDFLGMEFKLVPNEDYYTATTSDTPYGKMLTLTPKTQEEYASIYSSENAITLTITAILRVNEDATSDFYETGIVYTQDLSNKLRETESEGSLVSLLESSDIIVINNGTYPTVASKDGTEIFNFGTTVVRTNESWDNVEKLLGADNMPRSISFYARDFEAKTEIINILTAYNEGLAEEDQIRFSDTTSLITSSMGTVVDAISTVLIVFAAISLVVSSIMIGIITYVSVVERTREIGVLRALGARKKDISNVFIAETFVIGLMAGMMGVIVSYLLTFVINLIVARLFPLLSNLAQLSFLYHALPLVIISFILTMIAGIIPARIAAKKDPVIALRTE
ncbi:MAG TPA: ATP-binding cassette domain-containing protein [Eubacteriales bacterium]|nr:ATP-binding cassette domain-containing protein [Eubacteriales bacterium]